MSSWYDRHPNALHAKPRPTVVGIGPGRWHSEALAIAQEHHAHHHSQATIFRLYTEHVADFDYSTLVARYFPGATIYATTGLYGGQTEPGLVIEVSADLRDIQRAFDLAGDIRVACAQTSVLVTWAKVNAFEINDTSLADAQAAL